MQKIKELKNRIEKSNLSKQDKKVLLDAIEDDNFDLNNFLKVFLQVMSVSKELLKAFDIDIGDLIKDLFK